MELIPYSIEETDVVIKGKQAGEADEVIAARIGRSTVSVEKKRRELGFYCNTPRPSTAWPDERVARLKQLWAEGRSGTQIAAELNCGFSRNAIIGKLHRLGLGLDKPRPPTSPRPPRRKTDRGPAIRLGRQLAQPALPQAVEPPPAAFAETGPTFTDEPDVSLLAPGSRPVTFEGLRECHCKFPVGESTTWFCGAVRDRNAKGDQLPYCPYHCDVAYDRRRDRGRRREAA